MMSKGRNNDLLTSGFGWTILGLVLFRPEATECRSSLSLKSDEVVKFESKTVPRVGIYNPNFWTENNERSTSKSYTLWKQADVYLIEWPGNITRRDSAWPFLKWGKPRAKYLENRCCESWAGIEMRAYAYRYLFLTWGPYRFSQTYAPPLTIPSYLLQTTRGTKAKNTRTEVPIVDFGFVQDALLIILSDQKENNIIRVSGLELAYAGIQGTPLEPFGKYSLAKGISSKVNKVLTQYCCVKSESLSCPHGETVVAYREYSSDFRIFVSSDGGQTFKLLLPEVPSTSTLLHSVLSYPDYGKVVLLHGNERMATLDSYSMSTGFLISEVSDPNSNSNSTPGRDKIVDGIHGMLQASRIGEEMSVVIWDQCNVWYSLSAGRNPTKALFYIHGFIHDGNLYKSKKKHYILPNYCKFGINSSLAISNTGKLALLDSENIFHLGVDPKTEIFQLAALKVDMSLVLEKHGLSIVPHFDHNQHPKLLYPPRYLEVPDKGMLGKNYSQRLGIRLLPKTVFPSEFITVFYEENAWLPKKFKNFALLQCQTSSLSVNRSVSQKPKYYTFRPLEQVNFTIVFKSRLNSSRQLNYEPKDVNKFLEIMMRPKSIVQAGPEDVQYWITYEVVIKSRSLALSRRISLINFFTRKELRCNIQPSSPVYIKIEDNPTQSHENEEEMSFGSFLKTEEKSIAEYGRSYKATSCSCSTCSEAEEGGKKCDKKNPEDFGAGAESQFYNYKSGLSDEL